MVFSIKDAKLATHITLTQHNHFCGLYFFSEKKNHCWKNCWIILFIVLTKTGVLSIFGRLLKNVWPCNQLQPLKLKPNVTVVVFKLLGMDSSGCFLFWDLKTDDNQAYQCQIQRQSHRWWTDKDHFSFYSSFSGENGGVLCLRWWTNFKVVVQPKMFSKHLKNRYITFAIKQPLWPKALKLQSLLKWYKFQSLFTYDCSKLLRSFTIAGQNELTSCVTILSNGFARTWRLLTNVPFYIIVNYCLIRHSDLYIAVTPAEGTLQK